VTVLEDPPAPTAPDKGADEGGGGLVFIAMAGVLIALVATVVIIGLIGLLRDEDDGGSEGGSEAASGPTTIDVSLSEFAIDGNLAAAPGAVTLAVVNEGTQQHNLVVEELGMETPILNGGDTASLDLGTVEAGEYRVFCSVTGHAESGMDTTLVIGADASGDAASGGEAAAGDPHPNHGDWTSPDFDADLMDQIMTDSIRAFPAATEGMGNQLLEYELLPGGIKQFELTAAITPWEVSPGKFVDAWTYNGMVPGPMIKVDVGDTVRVIFNNDTPMGSDIHWHGLPVDFNQDGVSPLTQPVVKSGDSFVYEFTLDEPMIAMYHAHMHSQISVPNGMFAAFIVGENPIPRGETISGITIPEDLEPAVEIPMVLNDAGVIGLTLNGKSFPATDPLVLAKGQWASVHYYNEGLTAHPMHLHGFPQLVYAKDGIPLDYPYWADTINVAPGERYSVLFQGAEPGIWVWHCHILTHVESEDGLFGMATAVVVSDAVATEEEAAAEPVTEDTTAEG
jgi:FtsP/CotA-like multicopper oxidase with cupredoxin domain